MRNNEEILDDLGLYGEANDSDVKKAMKEAQKEILKELSKRIDNYPYLLSPITVESLIDQLIEEIGNL